MLDLFVTQIYTNDMNELKQFIRNSKKALTNLIACIEHHDIDIPTDYDLMLVREMFVYMEGYAECLEKQEDKTN